MPKQDSRSQVEVVKKDNKLEEFKEVTEPVVNWLQKNGDPHQKIIITLDSAELVSGEMGYSVEVLD